MKVSTLGAIEFEGRSNNSGLSMALGTTDGLFRGWDDRLFDSWDDTLGSIRGMLILTGPWL